MTLLFLAAAGVVWVLIALLVGSALGRAAALGDEVESRVFDDGDPVERRAVG